MTSLLREGLRYLTIGICFGLIWALIQYTNGSITGFNALRVEERVAIAAGAFAQAKAGIAHALGAFSSASKFTWNSHASASAKVMVPEVLDIDSTSHILNELGLHSTGLVIFRPSASCCVWQRGSSVDELLGNLSVEMQIRERPVITLCNQGAPTRDPLCRWQVVLISMEVW